MNPLSIIHRPPTGSLEMLLQLSQIRDRYNCIRHEVDRDRAQNRSHHDRPTYHGKRIGLLALKAVPDPLLHRPTISSLESQPCDQNP